MGVSIRLLRFICRKKPFYRVIASSSGTATISRISGKDGSKQMGLNFERVRYWLSVGAQPSDPVQNLLSGLECFLIHPRSQCDAREGHGTFVRSILSTDAS